jgi:uncharacterized short protein YbdD (DUF466 family)
MGSGALVVALLVAGPIVTFEWKEPVGATAPGHYEVEFTQEGMKPEVLTANDPSISLAPVIGRSFELRVRACLNASCGTWSKLSQALSINRSADFNGDGVVGVPDYQKFGRLMGTENSEADLNGDTMVGIPDFSEFAEHYSECIGKVDIAGEELPAYVACRAKRGAL